MKIDSHQHFWKYNQREYNWIADEMKILKRDYLPDELLTELTSLGFTGSISVQARQSLEETEWLLSLAQENSFIKGVVGWVDLCSSEVKNQLERFSKYPKLVGVRHVIHDEPDDNFMLRNDFLRGVESLQHYGLTYDILIFPKHLPNAIQLVSRFPQQIFVIDHIAKPLIKDKIIEPWKEQIEAISRYNNVYCKLSGMVTEANIKSWSREDFVSYLDIVFSAFGTNRLMIGSDWPVCKLGGAYSQVMNLVIDYIKTYPDEDIIKILGGNAIKAYNLKF